MDLSKFQELSKKTIAEPPRWIPPDYHPTWLLDGFALGLVGEAAEVHLTKDHDELRKELGDCIWYAAAICTTLNLNLFELSPTGIELQGEFTIVDFTVQLMVVGGNIADAIKKHTHHGKPLDIDVVTKHITAYIGNICCICALPHLDLSEVLQANLDKLQGENGRYKNGFSFETSAKRKS